MLTILDNKLHPSMHPQIGKPIPPRIEHNLLLDQMRAARAYVSYWNEPREMQALMVASMLADTTINAFRAYDMNPANNK